MWEGLFVTGLAGIQIRPRGACGGPSFLSVTVDLVELALFHFPSNAVMISYWLSGKRCQHGPALVVRRSPACQFLEGRVAPRGNSLASALVLHKSKEWIRTGCLSLMDILWEGEMPLLSPPRPSRPSWILTPGLITLTQDQINRGNQFDRCTQEIINDAPENDDPASPFRPLLRQTMHGWRIDMAKIPRFGHSLVMSLNKVWARVLN